MPETPDIGLCVIHSDQGVLLCQTVKSKTSYEVVLKDADNYLATSPDDWADIQVYIDELKRQAKKKCENFNELDLKVWENIKR